MSKKIDTSIKLNNDTISNIVKEKSEELKEYLKFYKDFSKGDVIFNEYYELFSINTKLPKTRESKVYEMCNLIYPSKFYQDYVTKKVKFELTFLVKKQYETIIIDGDVKSNDLINILRSRKFALKNNHPEIINSFTKLIFDMLHFMYENKESSEIVSHYGLQDNGGFAIGSIFIDKNGVISDCDTHEDLNILKQEFEPKGEFETFRNIINDIFTIPTIKKHKLYMLIMFSTPILSLVNRKGCLVNYNSKGTGLGKTISQQVSQMFYRNKFDIEMTFTPLAILNEAGLIKSFPIFIDEITNEMKKNPEQMSEFAYLITNGSDKKRLDKNAKARKTNTFRVNLGTSANNTFLSIISAESLAEMVRVLDINIEKSNINFDDLKTFALKMEEMQTNCAYGYYFIKKMLEQKKSIIETFNKNYDYITGLFGSTDFRNLTNTLAAMLTFSKLMSDLKFKIDLKEVDTILRDIIKETLQNFDEHRLSLDKVMNGLLSLSTNHLIQEPGKSPVKNTEYIELSNPDSYLINNRELIIPKSIFDTKVCSSTDKRFKPLFNKSTRQLIDFINENGNIATVIQKNIGNKRIQCVSIKLPNNYTTATIPLSIVSKEEEKEMIEAFGK